MQQMTVAAARLSDHLVGAGDAGASKTKRPRLITISNLFL
jgi:hypothetical protein